MRKSPPKAKKKAASPPPRPRLRPSKKSSCYSSRKFPGRIHMTKAKEGDARLFMPVSPWTPEPRSRPAIPLLAAEAPDAVPKETKDESPSPPPPPPDTPPQDLQQLSTTHYASGHSVQIAEEAAASVSCSSPVSAIRQSARAGKPLNPTCLIRGDRGGAVGCHYKLLWILTALSLSHCALIDRVGARRGPLVCPRSLTLPHRKRSHGV